MAERSIIVIGAGIAGLSAGCYGRMNGYRTRIFEMHDKPGGLCTAWSRQGYTVDGCIEWLVGTNPASSFHRIWEELGAARDWRIADRDVFMRVEGSEGQAATIFCDLDRLEDHLLELSPRDGDLIRPFVRKARALTRFSVPIGKAPETFSVLDGLRMMVRMLPHMPLFRRWGGVTLGEFAGRFRDPLLRDAFLALWVPESTILFPMMTLAWLHTREAGYPAGGSLPFARSIARRLEEMGGEIRYGARVTRILVEDDRAAGVLLADGSEHRADWIISAADLHATVFDLLDGRHADDALRGAFSRFPIFEPLILVAIGVREMPEGLPPTVAGIDIPVDPPDEIAGRMRRRLRLGGGFDEEHAPPGHAVLRALLPSEFGYWEELRKDRPGYEAQKGRVADTVIRLLDRRFPGLAAQVAMSDVATPVTFRRYTGNWQGSYEGWLLTPASLMTRMRKTLPGLSNLLLAGHWVEPGGGLPPAALSGRYAVQTLCKKEGRRFTASAP
jgi:phytoene dehydrogenase-like protein